MAQNTISDELNRLIQAKAGIKSALEEKGLTIGDSSTLDEFPGLIQEMEVGGGGYDTSTIIDLIEGDVSTFEIPYGTTKIRSYAFYNNSSLVDVTIPNTVTEIADFGFRNCRNLTKIYLPNSVKKIADSAFRDDTSLQTADIQGVTNSGINAFKGCSKLSSVIMNDVSVVDYYSFADCTSLTNVVFGNNLKNIYGQAFQNCNSLENIDISNVETIGEYAFRDCRKLKHITFGNALKNVDQGAFDNCINVIGDLILPASLQSIYMNVFKETKNIDSMVFLGNTPPTLGYTGSLANNKPIYVPGAALDAYKTKQYWTNYSTYIYPLASATYNSGTYTVTASGRDTLELYIDSSLINSSVYTFTPGAADASHNIMVKSVDPSLGVLDTYNLEVLVEGQSIPSTTPVIVLDPEVSQEEVDILDENDEPTGETETQEIPTGMYRVIATANSDTQYVSITVNGVDASNPTDYVYEAADGWDTPDSSLDATLVVTATCQEPGKTPTTVTEYYIEAESTNG